MAMSVTVRLKRGCRHGPPGCASHQLKSTHLTGSSSKTFTTPDQRAMAPPRRERDSAALEDAGGGRARQRGHGLGRLARVPGCPGGARCPRSSGAGSMGDGGGERRGVLGWALHDDQRPGVRIKQPGQRSDPGAAAVMQTDHHQVGRGAAHSGSFRSNNLKAPGTMWAVSWPLPGRTLGHQVGRSPGRRWPDLGGP